MPRTPDRTPGASLEEKLVLQDEGLTADNPGEVVFKDGYFSLRDALGAFDPRSGSGLSELQHEALDTLAHALTETHNLVVSRDENGRVSTVLGEEVGGTDIRKFEVLTRSGGKIATCRITQYDGDGTTIKRQLDVQVNRSGGKVTSLSIVRTT